MHRLTKISDTWYSAEMFGEMNEDEVDDIKALAEEGRAVIIVQDIEDAEEILAADGFEPSDVERV